MNIYQLSNDDVARQFAERVRAWRISPHGVGLSQADLARRSGIGLTPLRRFERTGRITLRNLIALLRVMDLLENLDRLIPDANSLTPLQVLYEVEQKAKRVRQRAPRKRATLPAL